MSTTALSTVSKTIQLPLTAHTHTPLSWPDRAFKRRGAGASLIRVRSSRQHLRQFLSECGDRISAFLMPQEPPAGVGHNGNGRGRVSMLICAGAEVLCVIRPCSTEGQQKSPSTGSRTNSKKGGRPTEKDRLPPDRSPPHCKKCFSYLDLFSCFI